MEKLTLEQSVAVAYLWEVMEQAKGDDLERMELEFKRRGDNVTGHEREILERYRRERIKHDFAIKLIDDLLTVRFGITLEGANAQRTT